MIVYFNTKAGFLKDASSGIEDIVREKVKESLRIDVKADSSEYQAWRNSLGNAMYHVMNTDAIPDNVGVAIEYSIPRSKKRIDFIITGTDADDNQKVLIIEIKQWSYALLTLKDAVVSTYLGRSLVERPHPSYQAYSYAALLYNFSTTVEKEKVQLKPCAYLHNYVDNNVILNKFYETHLENAPVFCKGDKEKLQEFISAHLKKGDNTNLLHRIDSGEIRPSKSLIDSLAKMLEGNQEFVLVDDQKIVYENALALARESSASNKNVLIVEGGPGTGKSVVAVNLLVATTALKQNSQYVTKNAAPREVFRTKLAGSMRRNEISALFTGSGSFTNVKPNTFDTLIIDEAHRLNEKSGMFKNLGENQIKELIEASKFSVFFIDEDQKVTWHDIGRKEEIERWAKSTNAKIHNLKLESQFRCNGSDGYLSWLDNTLQIKETANSTLDNIDYDFRVIDSPNELRELIFEKNKISNKARVVAGYCWNWISKKNKNLMDIQIPEYNFEMRWNLDSDGSTWIIAEDSVTEAGCIHTCQGLEVDYVGVIIGDDFVVRDGEVVTNPFKRADTDSSIKGYKTLLKENPDAANQKADYIIKNTYRTLMTRGMKGCYIFCTDNETQEYFKSKI